MPHLLMDGLNQSPLSSIPTANGLKSQLTINKTDRKDSGLYKCLAENLFGHSDHTINLVIQERPDPPDMLEVLEVSSRSVRLAWRVSFDGNSPIAGYIVQYKTAGPNGSNWQQPEVLNVTFPATVQTRIIYRLIREEVVISSLRPATVYGIRVAAINSIDRSLFTKPITLKTREEEPSESPKDVRVEAVDPGELILTWSVPPRESWNGELLGYVIIWKEHEYPANYTKSITVKGWATNNFQLTNLKKYTRYDIKISAFNSVASGPTSPSIIGTTREGVPEAPPQNVDCSETTSQIMKISWTPPPPNFHNGQIVGYKVLYKPYPSEILDIPTTREVKRTTSTETYLHGLYKFTNYSINVLAYTRAGDGVISDSVYCQTDEDFPDPPTSIKAAALTGESILVSWLSPNNHNGYIIMYNIYCREVGKVGTHTTYNLKTEDTILEPGLVHEVRNLKEHHLYEFWVSASTSVGEGEPTVIVTESTKSRAPSRIVSFSQIIQKPNKSKALLPCQAVGNPTPRTRWIRRGKPITFSPFYEITEEGHLKIHKVDPSLAGNYTCISNNLFGEDEITYTLVVLMPPSAPTLEVQFTTPNSIRLHWTHSENAGTPIQGKGSPSPIQTVSTKGGPPELPKEQEFITANATTLHLNLYSWPNGGCPISHFSVEYRAYSTQNWIVVAKSVTEENIAVQDLEPATWYQLKISADNDAGTVKGFFNFATTTISGGQIPMPLDLLEKRVPREESYFTTDTYIIIISSIVAGFIIFIILFLVVMNSRARTNNEEPNEQSERSNRRNRKQHNHAEKTAERDNRKNCKQILKTSPIRSHETLPDDIVQGNYEILPYATFSVPGSNTRAAPASTLDYTLQFKTFGHIEEGDRDARYPESIPGKHTWHKNFYYSNEVQNLHKMRLRESRLSTGGDSDSDDSGSPYGVGPVGTKYRVPVKPSGDFFRPDSSTESNDVSPLAERRPTPGPTPRYVVGKRPHRPTNNSCEDEHIIIESTPIEYLKIRPPTGFSDARESSEHEYYRNRKLSQLPLDLETFLARSDQKSCHKRRQLEKTEFILRI
ncbi:hypothetical protein NQ317_017933 [Molorchus minor]|uniref:Dscam n=1 Tax=Molorchus minor TaxID=1323400 RepID=A0ABQ9JRV5_9CUCU|nr:hypothetical protein NQ317_017933 [Molorchus minor]